MRWLAEDMAKLDDEVRRLESLGVAERPTRLAYVLVAESGANMLRAFNAASMRAERVTCR
jgi:hypothetical protein